MVLQKVDGEWRFRLASVMTIVVPGLFLIGLPFLTESPVWYMKKGQEGDARTAIVRVFDKDVNVEERLQVISSNWKC